MSKRTKIDTHKLLTNIQRNFLSTEITLAQNDSVLINEEKRNTRLARSPDLFIV